MPGQPSTALRTVAEGSNPSIRAVEIKRSKFQVGDIHLALHPGPSNPCITDTIFTGGTTGVLFHPGPGASVLQAADGGQQPSTRVAAFVSKIRRRPAAP